MGPHRLLDRRAQLNRAVRDLEILELASGVALDNGQLAGRRFVDPEHHASGIDDDLGDGRR